MAFVSLAGAILFIIGSAFLVVSFSWKQVRIFRACCDPQLHLRHQHWAPTSTWANNVNNMAALVGAVLILMGDAIILGRLSTAVDATALGLGLTIYGLWIIGSAGFLVSSLAYAYLQWDAVRTGHMAIDVDHRAANEGWPTDHTPTRTRRLGPSLPD